MEQIVNLHIKHLPEGVDLAISDELPGLVAQGRTVVETLEIARDAAKRPSRLRPSTSVATFIYTPNLGLRPL
jgi:hypothetical protein